MFIYAKFIQYASCNSSVFIGIFDNMKNPLLTNIAVSTETHKILVSHIQNIDGKIGKFADKAIREKIEKETKRKKSKLSI